MANVYSTPLTLITAVAFTFEGDTKAIVSNQKVRLALNYATDKKAIQQNVLGGYGIPSGCAITNFTFGYDKNACAHYEYNPERARQLLREAGYPNGFSMTMGTPNGAFLNDRQMGEAIVGQWAKVGVKVDLKVLDPTTMNAAVASRKIPVQSWLIQISAGYDADAPLSVVFYGGTVKGGPPRGLVSYVTLPLVDHYLYKGQSTVDPEVRKEAYRNVLKVLRAEVPYVYLFQLEGIYGVSKRVIWKPRPDQALLVSEMEWKSP